MSEKIFVGWVKVKDVEANGKTWQYTQISFKAEDLEKMAQYKNDAGYINLKLNRSQKGQEYLEIDTFGVNMQQPAAQQPAAPQSYTAPPEIAPMPEATAGGELDDTVPFNRLGDFEQ